jgi:hypothetical protein
MTVVIAPSAIRLTIGMKHAQRIIRIAGIR